MELIIVIALCVLDVAFAAYVIVWALYLKKDKKNNNSNDEIMSMINPIIEEKPTEYYTEVEEVAKEEPITEEVVEEESVEELPVISLEKESEEVNETEDNEDDESGKNKLNIARVPFPKKLLTLDSEILSYYDFIYNYFISYRKVNPRVSNGGASFRLGRDLIAKITVRGKTMKLNLALNVNNYDEKIYFQRDMSSVKAFSEIPFAVKVKSERGAKRAAELIAALAVEKGIEKKTRFTEVDALEEIKQKA